MELIISGENIKQLKKVEDLAKELGLKILRKKSISKKKENENSQKLYELKSKKAAEGSMASFEDPKKAITALKKLRKIGAFSDIDDPVAWQKEVRKERNIGRNG